MNAWIRPRAIPVDVTAVVIGGGHNGLAMSHCLTGFGIDHVVLERGDVANSWRTERWDSLRLLTPNWLCRLPGYAYTGDDPDGFMDAQGVVDFIEGYTRQIDAPIHTHTTVTTVRRTEGGYLVCTEGLAYRCRAVVMANGNFSLPKVPAISTALPPAIRQITAREYKRPDQVEEGGVLVVGASATGLQLALELQRAGRQVTLAVGEHVRMPRMYRGRDIQYWMDTIGLLNQHYCDVDDIDRARRVPSPQLVGAADRAMLDLNRLSTEGVNRVGRLSGVNGSVLQFSGALANHCKLADLKMGRLLKSIDDWIAGNGLDSESGDPERFPATDPTDVPRLTLDTAGENIRTVLWATGYRPDYSWLDVPVLDRKGNLRHDAGIVDSPGLYAMGMTFMRRRKSSFIHGAEDDAMDLAAHLADYVRGSVRVAAG